MIYAVYVPLLVPLLVVPFARPLARRVRPSVAAATLATVGGILAACSTVSLVLLAATHWPDFGLVTSGQRLPAGANPTNATVASAAALVALVTVGSATVSVLRRASAVRTARRRYGPVARTGEGGVPVTVVPSARPEAFSLPAGRRSGGVVVVSAGMLAGLDDDERAVLMAHERSHVLRRHHRLITVARISAVLHPVLWPLPGAVRYAVERWADEDAAAVSRDRRLSATAVGKAALLAHDYRRTAGPLAALGVGGAVPQRVVALLAPPPPAGRWIMAAGALVALVSGVAAAEGVRDLGHLLALWTKQ
jgi:hypothetical protein